MKIEKHIALRPDERDEAIIKIIETLLDSSVPFSGPHRKRQWEKGWRENLKAGDSLPRYFGKYPINRLNRELVRGLEPDYEVNMLYNVLDPLFNQYLTQDDIYEFGCGTGHNLVRMRNIRPTARLWGLDWATSSQKILRRRQMKGERFDFFKPSKFKLASGAGVYTVAALEQIGTGFRPFVGYLLKQKPSIVLHVEPIAELLDSKNLLDFLSIKYFEKRKYLKGYLTYLRSLESQGKIKIHEARRSGVGSLFVDGYSIIAWSPIS